MTIYGIVTYSASTMILRPSGGFTAIRAYGTRTHVMPRTHIAHRPPMRLKDPLSTKESVGVQHLEDDNLTFIHRPPPSAPTPFSTTLNPSSPLLRSPTKVKGTRRLPPLLRPSAYVKEPPRVSPEIIKEIRRLREEDPNKYTRSVLADKFNTTSHFVALVAAMKPRERKKVLKKREEKHQKNRESWGDKKSLVMDIRKKRREFW